VLRYGFSVLFTRLLHQFTSRVLTPLPEVPGVLYPSCAYDFRERSCETPV